MGTNIIGASGRVDILGELDQDSVMYLAADSPTLTTETLKSHEAAEERSRPLFEGVTGEGWCWIEQKRLGKVRILDEQLFLGLLAKVSDYIAG